MCEQGAAHHRLHCTKDGLFANGLQPLGKSQVRPASCGRSVDQPSGTVRVCIVPREMLQRNVQVKQTSRGALPWSLTVRANPATPPCR